MNEYIPTKTDRCPQDSEFRKVVAHALREAAKHIESGEKLSNYITFVTDDEFRGMEQFDTAFEAFDYVRDVLRDSAHDEFEGLQWGVAVYVQSALAIVPNPTEPYTDAEKTACELLGADHVFGVRFADVWERDESELPDA